jgi:FKBP-type peptidyl-prolyl cis-trans isomerase FkpA
MLWISLALLALAGCKKEEAAKPAAASAPGQMQGQAAGGSEYLDKAAKEPGAEQIEATGRDGTKSHLVLQVLQQGSGASPSAGDMVKVNYKGTLTDGKVFDASEQHGGPAEFPLGRVIPCWTQGVQHMKVGEKAKLVCPPELAYGPRGAPPVIPPNATLVFEVELLGIGGK